MLDVANTGNRISDGILLDGSINDLAYDASTTYHKMRTDTYHKIFKNCGFFGYGHSYTATPAPSPVTLWLRSERFQQNVFNRQCITDFNP
jgi:hypothetical protein